MAAKAARDAGSEERLRVVSGEPPPHGWTGKLWAVSQGIADAARQFHGSEYFLLTDADIAHAPDNLRRLVERAQASTCDLVSLMVEMPHESFAERAFLPAFVFFFAMLFPFAWVRDRKRHTAAAAGGVMLVRVKALEAIGGIAAIRDALIDDCALGKALKKNGPIWLGLAPQATRSLRRYPRMGEIWAMIVRSAYTELRHSPIRLLATVVGMGLTFLVPPLLIFAGGIASLLGLLASALMVFAYVPTLRRCRLSYFWAPALPLIALFYLIATLESARRYHAGQGGQWKGRTTLKGTA
jgi:hopene-associated glycosyltransferase HpnB